MLDSEPTGGDPSATPTSTTDSPPAPRRRRAAARPAGPPETIAAPSANEPATAEAADPASRPRTRRRTTKAAAEAGTEVATSPSSPAQADPAAVPPALPAPEISGESPAEPVRPRRRRRTAADTAPADTAPPVASDPGPPPPPMLMFQAPVVLAPPEDDLTETPAPRRRSRSRAATPEPEVDAAVEPAGDEGAAPEPDDATDEDGERTGRRRRRGRRGRGRTGEGSDTPETADADVDAVTDAEATDAVPVAAVDPDDDDETSATEGSGTRRRRRRRRRGGGGEDAVEPAPDDPPNTVVRVRQPRTKQVRDADEVQGVRGSTRLEARRQRRRDSRDSSRRRPSVISESEFLARREAVERVMVVRESAERTQIAVLEDGVLVEHYVTRAAASSYVGNVYLGRVQNVLPSMEAAFVDIGKGRNAVLYAGEVNYDASSLDGRPQRIEQALKSGQSVLVQVTKDPIGSKGARLTSQVSLPGRYLVYVPDGSMTGISRKLPDTERSRLKSVLKRVVPEDAGVIVRTAAEGAAEEELTRDVARLSAQWENITQRAGAASAPALLYAEPDLVVRVIRDLFNEDFVSMVVQGDDEWDTIEAYVDHVAPDLRERVSRWSGEGDIFASYRVDEQIAKALERRVYLPSGGSLVIDRTEAMIVIDVNTGKFTGAGGNLEETVTRNNLEAAEEIVRQLRLRDLGGIIVIDFIDMVLESNRDLVLRRLLECLGRDRTKHQVAEVTSLGLVQMTRKRVGQGLVEAFSEICPECSGRGIKLTADPFQPASSPTRSPASSGRRPALLLPAGPPATDSAPSELVVRPVAGESVPTSPVPTPGELAASISEATLDGEAAPAPRPRARRTATRKAGAAVAAPAAEPAAEPVNAGT